MSLLKLLLWLLVAQFIFCNCVDGMRQRQSNRSFWFKASLLYAPSLVEMKQACKKPYHFVAGRIRMPYESFTPQDEDELDDDILEKSKTKLMDWWPDLTKFNFEISKQYWKRLYKRRGGYRNESFSQEDFIAWGIYVGETYGVNIISYLKNAGIVPNDIKAYHPNRIADAIERSTHGMPEILCVFHDGKYYLTEIILCINSVGRVMDCFDRKKFPQYCHGIVQVYYPEP